jgi:hypothetical protein
VRFLITGDDYSGSIAAFEMTVPGRFCEATPEGHPTGEGQEIVIRYRLKPAIPLVLWPRAMQRIDRVGAKYSDIQLQILLKAPSITMTGGGMQPVVLKPSELEALSPYLRQLH